MGSVRRCAALPATVLPTILATVLATVLAAVTPLQAAAAPGQPPKPWDGRYELVTYGSLKAGSSPAAHVPEDDVHAVVTLATTCSFDRCVATATPEAGSPPANPTMLNPIDPGPIRYSWNGTGWATSYDWLWGCALAGDHRARATSFTLYTPQPDGSLRGTWHTDISEGPCRGTVLMPVAAFPA